MRGLLDLTDNIVAGETVPPPGVVRYDDDDPYLVVAADKARPRSPTWRTGSRPNTGSGSATRSPPAARPGYDHKARWGSPRAALVEKRRLPGARRRRADDGHRGGNRDMAGGRLRQRMLLSCHLKLVAAFNHERLPRPRPGSRGELPRARAPLALPRSSWADYDPAEISEGGGVFPRTAKSIELSPQARAALGIEAEALRRTS